MNPYTLNKSIPWWMFVLVGLLCVVAITAGLAEASTPTAGWEKTNGYLLFIGFPFFLLSFVASSVRAYWPGRFSDWLLRYRRHLGLNFALTHFLHFYAVLKVAHIADQDLSAATLFIGGAIYVLLGLMVVTSNDYAQNKLGKYWRYLHKTGMYYLWFIFTLSYGALMVRGNAWIFAIPTTLLAGAFLLRITARYKKKRAG
jgi:DMSO/TMAO reductase YedYZ heme-binding membrane subunit